MNSLKLIHSVSPGCFFCGVDSRAAAWFLGLFVVSLVLASVAFFLWATAKGDFDRLETTAWEPLRDPEPLESTDERMLTPSPVSKSPQTLKSGKL